MTRAEYIEAIKKAAISSAKSSLIKVLLIKVPWLFYGPLSALTGLVIEKLLEILINETEFAIFLEYIDLRVDKQGRDFSEACINNHKIQKTGTPDEKKKSEEILITKFRSLTILRN